MFATRGNTNLLDKNILRLNSLTVLTKIITEMSFFNRIRSWKKLLTMFHNFNFSFISLNHCNNFSNILEILLSKIKPFF